MNFVEQFKSKIKTIDDSVNRTIDRVEIVSLATEIPKDMEVPNGDIFAVFKRSNLAKNIKLLMNLPMNEAVFWATVFNQRELHKRDLMSEIPEEVWFFDCVRQKSEEESVFWNPAQLTKDELEIERIPSIDWKD